MDWGLKNERRGLGWGQSLRWVVKGERRVDVREDFCWHRDMSGHGSHEGGAKVKGEGELGSLEERGPNRRGLGPLERGRVEGT